MITFFIKNFKLHIQLKSAPGFDCTVEIEWVSYHKFLAQMLSSLNVRDPGSVMRNIVRSFSASSVGNCPCLTAP